MSAMCKCFSYLALTMLTVLRALGEIMDVFSNYFLIRWFPKTHAISVWRADNGVNIQLLGLLLSS